MRLAKGLQILPAADVLQMGVGDDEIGCEHGGGDFAAVEAVADEAVNHARALSWLRAVCHSELD